MTKYSLSIYHHVHVHFPFNLQQIRTRKLGNTSEIFLHRAKAQGKIPGSQFKSAFERPPTRVRLTWFLKLARLSLASGKLFSQVRSLLTTKLFKLLKPIYLLH